MKTSTTHILRSLLSKTTLVVASVALAFSASAQNVSYSADATLQAPVSYSGLADFLASQAGNNRGTGSGNSTQNYFPTHVSPTFGAIQGPDSVCSFADPVTYSVAITSINGSAVQYYWFVPADWTILSGQNTNSITVLPGSMSGYVAVFAMGHCICHYSCMPVNSRDCGPIDPLPVELISFDAARTQNAVNLTWATAQEINNNYFEIERSKDGKSFVSVGTVKGNGTTTYRMDYSFTDKNAGQAMAYYRLKQVDFDGKTAYSPVRVAKAASNVSIDITAFPNPASDVVTLQNAEQLDANATIRISSVTGQTVWSGTARDLAANNHRLNISHLNAGIYVATVAQGAESKSFRIVKN